MIDALTDSWKMYDTVGNLPDADLDALLTEFASAEPGDHGFPNFTWLRHRRNLIKPTLTVAKLREDRTYGPLVRGEASDTRSGVPQEAVDIVLQRYYSAEMLEDSFTAQIVVGADHAFGKTTTTKAVHSRTIDGRVREYLPLRNVPFLEGVMLAPGALLSIKLIHVDGAFNRAAMDLLKSTVFQSGVKLTKSFNPIFGCAANYIGSVTEFILSHRRNRVISEGLFGLYDYGGPLSVKMDVGDYLFVQLPTEDGGRVQLTDLYWDEKVDFVMHGGQPLDANYFMIRIAISATNNARA